MTWLARLSLRNRALVGLVSVLLVAFGVFSTTSLRQELFPSLDVPVASIASTYQGASADIVEQQVTTPVEQAVQRITGVTGTSSQSSGGSSVVTLNLQYGTNLTDLTSQVQRALAGITLPTGVTPQVITGGLNSLPVIQLAVSSDLPPDQVANILRTDVQPYLGGLTGVSQVTLNGIADQQVTIAVDPAAGVPVAALTSLLQANGVRVPAGQLTPTTNPLTVEVGTPITTVQQLQDLYVTGARGPVRLGDVATITSAAAPPTGYTRTNGQPSIGIGVVKTPDANTVTVSDEVRAALTRITDSLGGPAQHAQATVVFDQAPFITQSVHDLTTEGLLGLAFAIVVILGFLLSVRATLVTAVSIPLSVLIAMIVLNLGGFTLNILTLGALTVAIGRVVDDSIVVIENITRHARRRAERRIDARTVVEAVKEVAAAITASTITTVAVFAPIGLVGGQVGQLFSPFAVTVTAALLASLLVSLTVVPVLAAAILRGRKPAPAAASDSASDTAPDSASDSGPEPVEEKPGVLQRGYLPVVGAAIRRPVVTLLIAVLVLVGTGFLLPRLTTNFIGDAGGNTVSVTQELPAGTALPQADAAARKVEDVVRATAGVAGYQVTVGGGSNAFGRPAASASTRFSITLADTAKSATVQDDLRSRFSGLTDVGTLTVGGGQGGLGSSNLSVAVAAQDPQVLAQAADQVQKAVSGIAGVSDVRNDLAAALPTVEVQVNRQEAAAAGLTEAQVGQFVSAALRGSTIGRLTIGGVQQAVILRAGQAPTDVPSLRALPITGSRGPVPLSQVATVTETKTAPTITHTNGSRSATITARPTGSDVGAASRDLTATLKTLSLPPGATATIGGVSTQQSDAFGQLGLALLAAIAVVYLVMVVTFRSLVQPLILLVSVPFAATGAVGLLVATHTPLGVPALIGMLMLVGIVVTNAIVLIDLVNQFRRGGAGVRDAVLHGAGQRVRPIIMTAVATIMALLPMSLGLTGGGVFISQPLAIVVIGGLITSTLLTLVLVPVLYVLVEKLRRGGPPSDPLADPPVDPLAPSGTAAGPVTVGAGALAGAPAEGGGVAAPGMVAPVGEALAGPVALGTVTRGDGVRSDGAWGDGGSGEPTPVVPLPTTPGVRGRHAGPGNGLPRRQPGAGTPVSARHSGPTAGNGASADVLGNGAAEPGNGNGAGAPGNGVGGHGQGAGEQGNGAAEPPTAAIPAVPPPPAVPQGPGLHGRVVDAAGKPLAGASVVAFDQAGHQLGTTAADPLGRYALALPGAAEYLVVVHGTAEPSAEWVRGGATSTRHDTTLGGEILTDR